MRRLSKKYRILAAAVVLLGIFIGMFSQDVGGHDWYDSFFNDLHDKKIDSYRLLFVWVQGDMAPGVRPIGGNQNNFESWKKHTEALLTQALRRRALDSNASQVIVEVVLDEATYVHHLDLLERWQREYPSQLRVTQLDKIRQTYPQISWALDQCDLGIAALCSDVIRIWHLPKEFDMNVYLDIDTFIDRHEHPNRLSSAIGLGSRVLSPGVYHAVQTSANPKDNLCNNDMLVDYGATNWPLIHAMAASSLDSYRGPWISLSQRHLWRGLDGEKIYEQQLEKRLAWWVAHPAQNFHPLGMIVHINGPWFWLHLSAEGHSAFYQIPIARNSGSWKGGSDVSIKGSMNYGALHYWLGSDAQDVLKLTMMAYDYQYLTSHQVVWRCALAAKIAKQWLRLSEDKGADLKKVLGSPMLWAEGIAHEGCNAILNI